VDERLRLHGRRFMQLSFLLMIAGYIFLISRWTN
jgi:hypothetical protein